MKQVKLKHSYHDARIKAIRYCDDRDVVLDVHLCSCCNPSQGPATLSFLGLRNFAQMQAALEIARQANAGHDSIDEIIGILRDDERGYILDLATAGSLHLDPRGLHEA